MINVYFDAAVRRVVFVLVRDAATFGGYECVGEIETADQEAGYLQGPLLGKVEVVDFGAFVICIAGDEDM